MATRIISGPATLDAARSFVPDAVGPFSPLEGPNSVTFTGSISALARLGVDVPNLDDMQVGQVVSALDAAGHHWFLVLRRPGWLVSAFRERSVEERSDFIDKSNEMIAVQMPKARLLACRRISQELKRITESMSPDRSQSRTHRRHMKHRMHALTALQWELLSTPPSMSEVRARMAELELPMKQVDYVGELFGA